MAPHSSTLAWKIPWVEEPGRLQFIGSRRVRHDWVTSRSLFTFMHGRSKWRPTPVFLPGESQGRGSLVGYQTRLKWLSSSRRLSYNTPCLVGCIKCIFHLIIFSIYSEFIRMVQYLSWEDPLETEMATHSNILAWRILWTEESGGLQSTGSHRVRHEWRDLALRHNPIISQGRFEYEIFIPFLWAALFKFSSVARRVWLFETPWTAARQASLPITNCLSLFKLMSIESVMPSNHVILCHPLLLPP